MTEEDKIKEEAEKKPQEGEPAKKEPEKKIPEKKDTAQGTPPAKEEGPIEKANKAADRLAEQNKRMEANIKKQEELIAEMKLTGKSLIGQGKEEKEETAAEYKNRVMQGNL